MLTPIRIRRFVLAITAGAFVAGLGGYAATSTRTPRESAAGQAPTVVAASHVAPSAPVTQAAVSPAPSAARPRAGRPAGWIPLKPSLRRHGRPESEMTESGGGRGRAEREREGINKPRPDHPDEAMRFRRQSLMDENGVIPMDGLERAKAHMQQMRTAGDGPAAAGINRTSWTWLGPGNIGGRTRALAIHPTNTSIIFAGTVGGGIWKTTNGGASWAPVDDFMANLAVSSIVFKPGDPTTMYAGTGEGFFNADGLRGAGIFRSTDSGVTWAQLPSTNNANFLFVNRLAVSADAATLLAATRTGLYRSGDAGASWTRVLLPSFNNTVADVKFLPGSSAAAVAAGYTGAAFFTSNVVTGSWTTATGLAAGGTFTRVELGTSVSSPNTVYAVVDTSSAQLWKSTNGGASYSLVSTPGHLSGQGWYDNAIWVDPTTDGTLVVGGVDLWRSTNSGVNFTKISTWFNAPNSAHADHHAIVSDPNYNGTTNKRVYFGNDGGVYKADNVSTVTSGVGGGFTPLNNNLGVTQFYGAAGHAGTGKITGGTQDNGTLLYTTSGGAQGWTAPFGGDGGFSAYDPTNANYFYGEYVYLKIHRNSTGGSGSSQYIWGLDPTFAFCKSAPYSIVDACNFDANFIAPFVLDPNDPDTLLAGGASLWRTNDVKAALTPTTGPLWAAIKPAISNGFGGFSYISAIAVAMGNSNTIFVGHNNGDIYRTLTGAAPWTKVDSTAMPNVAVQRVAIDPANPNVVYAAFGGFTATNLWKSMNGGATWSDATGADTAGLPDVPIRGIAIHPTTANWIYVGTEVGVFASTDGGATWGLPQDGPANVSVDELFWMGTTLVAATHGRGIYKTPTTATGIVVSDMSLDSPSNGSVVGRPFTTQGWALNQSATGGTGVDTVHVYAFPTDGSAAIFLGVATYGIARGDVVTFLGLGPQFTNCGFTLTAGGSLSPGSYTVVAYAHNAATGAFDVAKSASITISTPVSIPRSAIYTPGAGSSVNGSFQVSGWSADTGAASGTGVDAVHVYAFASGSATPIFLGVATYGDARGDVGAIFGSQFTNTGYHLTVNTLLAPGAYTLAVYSRSTVSGNFTGVVQTFTREAGTVMSVDTPGAGATVTLPFLLAGWAIDRDAPSGTGVDAVQVYAFASGSATPIFLGYATYGDARGDVATFFGLGPQFTNSGYHLTVNTLLAPNTSYTLYAYAHSTVTGTFNQVRTVTVTVQ